MELMEDQRCAGVKERCNLEEKPSESLDRFTAERGIDYETF